MVYVMVARLELSQTDPRLSTLERLAAALRIDVVDLLTSPPKAKRPAPREVIGPDGRRGEWYARYWTADEQEKKEKGGTKSAAPDLS